MNELSAEARDHEHLRLLSIFFIVFAALVGVFSLFPIFHFIMGLILSQSGEVADGERVVGAVLAVGAGILIGLGLLTAVLLFLAGRSLASQTRYTFCLVMAAVACLFVPLGTILGISAIFVLQRQTVKALFDG